MSDFLQDLKKVLEDHDVEIRVDDHFTGYAECGQDLRISADFNWRKDGNTPYDIDFGGYIDIDKIEDLIEEIIKGELKDV